jgi:imidazole glycerol-phosphate synthase subunit HisF
MLKKRLIAVVIVKDNTVVQSINFSQFYPIGNPRVVIDNLNRWNVDEILVLDISATKNFKGPNMKLVEEIGSMGISTPLAYGGGISNSTQAKEIISCGFERISINQSFFNNREFFKKISYQIGSQAIILAYPCTFYKKNFYYFDYIKRKKELINLEIIKKNQKYFSEILLMDVAGDGGKDKFNDNLFNFFRKKKVNDLLIFGGLTNLNQIKNYMNYSGVKGIGIGNSLNYTENAYQKIKENLIKINVTQVRNPVYQKENN